VRIFNPRPRTTNEGFFKQRIKKKAKTGHVLLYVAALFMPLSAWLLVSASPVGLPTFVFVDWIKWPHIPGVATEINNRGLLATIYMVTAAVLFALLVGHISAVTCWQKTHGVNLLNCMWWSKGRIIFEPSSQCEIVIKVLKLCINV